MAGGKGWVLVSTIQFSSKSVDPKAWEKTEFSELETRYTIQSQRGKLFTWSVIKLCEQGIAALAASLSYMQSLSIWSF